MNLQLYLINDWDKLVREAEDFAYDIKALNSYLNSGSRKSSIDIRFWVNDSELFSKMVNATDDYVTVYLAYQAICVCSIRVSSRRVSITDVNIVNLVRWVNNTYGVDCNKYDTNLPKVWA